MRVFAEQPLSAEELAGALVIVEEPLVRAASPTQLF
jgi:hypothetical protein